jgi:hypothetical protein
MRPVSGGGWGGGYLRVLTLAQRHAVERELGAVPDDLEPRHPVDPLRLKDFAADAVEPRQKLGNPRQIIVPFAPLGRRVALLEAVFERREDADDVLFDTFIGRPSA